MGMVAIGVHLSNSLYEPRVIPVSSEARVTAHQYSNGPYVEAKLVLDGLEIAMYVDTSATSLALAAALEKIAGVLRTYEANLPAVADAEAA